MAEKDRVHVRSRFGFVRSAAVVAMSVVCLLIAPAGAAGGRGRGPSREQATAQLRQWVVNTTGDNTDGACNLAHCSLREALIGASASAGTNQIHFDIDPATPGCDASGRCVISPTTQLPSIEGPDTTIDGFTQPGAQPASGGDAAVLKIVLDGSAISGYPTGLSVTASGTIIRGLVIGGFASGIAVRAGEGISIAGSYIGVDSDGVTPLSNTCVGILVSGFGDAMDPAHVNIGGSVVADRVVIGANGCEGVGLGPSRDVTILGSHIGVDAFGGPLGNGGAGVRAYNSSFEHKIGGRKLGWDNVIAHNAGDGVLLTGDAGTVDQITVSYNQIFANGGRGIVLDDANGNLPAPVITAATATSADGTACPACFVELFSDTGGQGAIPEGFVQADLTNGDWHIEAADGVLVGPNLTATSTESEGRTSEFSAAWVIAPTLTATPSTATPTGTQTSTPATATATTSTATPTVTGSPPGQTPTMTSSPPGPTVTPTSTPPLPSATPTGSPPGPTPTSMTLTVNTTSDTDDGACDTVHCGLREALKAAARRRGPDRIEFRIPASDTGCSAGGACVIGVRTELPIITDDDTVVDGYTQPGAHANTAGLGLPIDAVLQIEVLGEGIVGFPRGIAVAASRITVQGLAIGGFNSGIFVHDGDDVRILGNFVGVRADGMTAMPNRCPGVVVAALSPDPGPFEVTVGGVDPASRNLISGNACQGVSLEGGRGHVVIGNHIGVDRALGALPNDSGGVGVFGPTNGHRIGGRGSGEPNLIAYNSGPGVALYAGGGSVSSITISRNAIFGNSTAGIRLTAGANDGIPAPVIVESVGDRILGTACPGCLVEVFSDALGQGELFEGETRADAAGVWALFRTARRPNLTATSTDAVGNTSQFSAPVPFDIGRLPTPTGTATTTATPDGVGGHSLYLPRTYALLRPADVRDRR